MGEYYSPTVVPTPNCNPVEDAKTLRAAMKGLGTDEEPIIQILTNRSNLQRQQIAHAFKVEYGRDLIEDLTSELGGKFEKLVLALMEPPLDFLVNQIHNAMKGAGTDDAVLCEILCTRTNAEVKEIAQAYEQKFGKSLESAIEEETSSHYKSLLVLLINGVRDERSINPQKAKEQAEKLYAAGEGQWGTDEEVFVVLLAHESMAQLQLVFKEYENISGKSIEDAIKSEFSGDLQIAVLTIAKCAKDRMHYYAEKLYKAMKGFGTDDPTLIRIIVSRCELDLGAIKNAYLKAYETPLYDAVKSDTSGDYKTAILNLIQP